MYDVTNVTARGVVCEILTLKILALKILAFKILAHKNFDESPSPWT